ncbi:MAG: hypothetical protein LBH54_03965 [Clostridiales bacterium]|nr:hypothetical protein [Clostridiales bacterium]
MQSDETQVIRDLAKRYMEVAASEENAKKRNLWKGINQLTPERPAVLVEELPWHEMGDADALTPVSADADIRKLELFLRRGLFRAEHIHDDYVFLPYYRCVKTVEHAGFGIAVQEETLDQGDDNNIVSHHYNSQINSEEDLEKIKMPQAKYNEAATMKTFEKLSEVLGDAMPVRVTGDNLAFQIWDWLARIMSPDQILLDMAMRPELMHGLIARAAEAYRQRLRQYNEQRLIDKDFDRVHCSFIFNDELNGAEDISQNTWTYGTAQLFGSVSPAMHKEFEFDYVKDLYAEFGLTMYGCCEPLHDRMELLFDAIPNLRKISLSPWCDIEIASMKMGKNYVGSVKPNPASVECVSVDWDEVRRDLTLKRDVCAGNGTPAEFILKDISTVHRDPARLTKWANLASELVRA